MQTSELLLELKKLLNDVIRESVKSGGDNSEADFVDRGHYYLERLILGEYIGKGRFFNRHSKDQANLENIWNEIRAEILPLLRAVKNEEPKMLNPTKMKEME